MRDYFKRAAVGIFWLSAIIAVAGFWFAPPIYVIMKYCHQFNWWAVGALTWLVFFPVFIFSAMGDDKPISMIPPAPPPKPKPKAPPKREGRMGG